MAQPNLINTTSCFLKFATVAVSTSGQTLLSSATDKQRKIVSLYACNTGTATKTLDIYFTATGVTRYVVKEVPIPAKTTLVVITRDTPVHFEEGNHSLTINGSATGIDVYMSYEEYDDA
tara:strand:- start:492 stop:848 length:357 start_codon:yes stop_codon:yes gene_type:complete